MAWRHVFVLFKPQIDKRSFWLRIAFKVMVLIICGKCLRDFFLIDISRIFLVHFRMNKAAKTLLTHTNHSWLHMTDGIVYSISDSPGKLLFTAPTSFIRWYLPFLHYLSPSDFFPRVFYLTLRRTLKGILATKIFRWCSHLISARWELMFRVA